MKQFSGLLLGFAILAAGTSPVGAEGCGGASPAARGRGGEEARDAGPGGEGFGALQRLLGNDLVYIHSSAVVDNKASYIDSMKSGTVKYRVMRRSDVTVRTFGCIAIISGLGNFDVTVKGQDLAVEIRFHSIWAKRDRGLEFVSWEATRTPPKQ